MIATKMIVTAEAWTRCRGLATGPSSARPSTRRRSSEAARRDRRRRASLPGHGRPRLTGWGDAAALVTPPRKDSPWRVAPNMDGATHQLRKPTPTSLRRQTPLIARICGSTLLDGPSPSHSPDVRVEGRLSARRTRRRVSGASPRRYRASPHDRPLALSAGSAVASELKLASPTVQEVCGCPI